MVLVVSGEELRGVAHAAPEVLGVQPPGLDGGVDHPAVQLDLPHGVLDPLVLAAHRDDILSGLHLFAEAVARRWEGPREAAGARMSLPGGRYIFS